MIARLAGFQRAVEAGRAVAVSPPVVEVVTGAANAGVQIDDVAVNLPDGKPLVAGDGLAIPPGDRVLVTGPSGSGKSTLFRAIAGIWPFGKGRIVVPADARLMMLPQRPYFPVGTLSAAITYPAETGTFSAQQIAEALRAVGLPALAGRLDEDAHWNRMLSLGEQQRLGIARALLQAPDYLFLDEATASLDEASEAALYKLLQERLPKTTLVSIGHRSTLNAFHRRRLSFERDGERHRVRQTAIEAVAAAHHHRAGQDAPLAVLLRHDLVPGKRKSGEHQRADADRRQQERPRHAVDDHDKRIDSCRWMKRPRQVHRDHREANRQCRHPGARPRQLQHDQADQRRYQMTADQCARLRRFRVWRSHHQHDRGGEGDHHQREFRAERSHLHHGHGDRGADRAGDDNDGLATLDHAAQSCNGRASRTMSKRSGRQPCGCRP